MDCAVLSPQSQSVGWHLPYGCTVKYDVPPVQRPSVSHRRWSSQWNPTITRVTELVAESMLCQSPCSAGVEQRALAGAAAVPTTMAPDARTAASTSTTR